MSNTTEQEQAEECVDVFHFLVNKSKGIRRIDEFPNMTNEMLSRSWSNDRIFKVLGDNWLRILGDVWC